MKNHAIFTFFDSITSEDIDLLNPFLFPKLPVGSGRTRLFDDEYGRILSLLISSDAYSFLVTGFAVGIDDKG